MRYKCNECDYVCDESELLSAPNPFIPDDIITGCPRCKLAEVMQGACDEPGCNDFATCGTLTNDNEYRVTCGKHWPGRKTA